MTALLLIGAAISIGALGFAFDAFGTDEDNDTVDPPEVPESGGETGGGGTGGEGTGGGGTGGSGGGGTGDGGIISSGDGTSASETIVVGNGDVVAGGGGDDIFLIAETAGDTYTPANDAVITDFESGEDQLVITSFPENGDDGEERLDVFDWEIREDVGAVLTREVDNSNEILDVVTLEGLTTPPPIEDLAFRITSGVDPMPDLDAEDVSDLFPGNGAGLVLRFDGTTGDDTVDFDTGGTGSLSSDVSRVAIVDTDGGDDTVDFAGARIDADLGAGDDVYTGRTEILAGESDALEDIDGGAGDDTITASESAVALVGGAGDDDISATSAVSGSLEGGEGDDTLTGARSADAIADQVAGSSESLTMTGGAGADVFEVVIPADPAVNYDSPILTDFDQAEDGLVIILDEDYTGAGEVSLVERPGGGGAAVELDGRVIVEVATSLTDISAVSVVASTAA